MLDRAARAALRAEGLTGSNPLVGCVIVPAGVDPISEPGRVITASHRRFGGPHAEAAALAVARERGVDVRGAAVYVTLEPCNHTGKTPPCAAALVEARVGEVVAAARDPNGAAAGGFDTLQRAGVRCRFSGASRLADLVSEPFLTRVRTRRPWVVAKWAQTLDGKLAASTGHAKWITGEPARRVVHRLRARVDAIITGVGTVIADDPLLTARAVRTRSIARRVVLDPSLRTPLSSALVESVATAPLTIYTGEPALAGRAEHAAVLQKAGVDLAVTPLDEDGRLSLHAVLSELTSRYGVATAAVEAGPRLLSAMLRGQFIDEARVHIAPALLGDPGALALDVREPRGRIDLADRFRLVRITHAGRDTLLTLRRGRPLVSPR